MKIGVHLPLMEFRGEGQSHARVMDAVDAARECGLAAISSNDHFVFSTPWLDGLTALAATIERSGEMTLATTISLAGLRGPVPLAKTLAAIDILSEGRLIAGVGPGSSARDFDAVGVDFDQRWPRFEESVVVLRALLKGETPPPTTYFATPDAGLAPRPHRAGGVPLWIGSWGSDAGLRRVARLADGWLASAYNTTPEAFGDALQRLREHLRQAGTDSERFPNAIATMFLYLTEDASAADAVLTDVLAPILRRPPEELRERLLVGSAGECADKLARYEAAGAERVLIWPVGDELNQLERFHDTVMARL